MSGAPLDLAGLQRWMQAALLSPAAEGQREQAARLVAPSQRLSGPDRLAIYQRGYHVRLLECMKVQFKALCHALGEELFTDFALEYLRARPSQSATLGELGDRFPDYLDETRPDRGAPPEERAVWADFMVDLARFERELLARFDAVGHEGRPYADASAPDARLRLQPCFALGAYRFPVDAYFRRVRAGEDPEVPDLRATWVAFARRDYLTGVHGLTRLQYAFLQALAAGRGIAEALAETAAEVGLPREELTTAWDRWREKWIEAGFFIQG